LAEMGRGVVAVELVSKKKGGRVELKFLIGHRGAKSGSTGFSEVWPGEKGEDWGAGETDKQLERDTWVKRKSEGGLPVGPS